MRDDNTRHTELLLHPNDQPVDYRHSDRIQSRRRFVVKQVRRSRGDGPGEPGPLHHPTGQLGRIPVFGSLQIDERQTLTHTCHDLVVVHLRHTTKSHRHVLGNVHGVEQRGELKDVADIAAEFVELLDVEFTHVLAIHDNVTGVGPKQAHHVFEDHRLARSGEPDDAERLAIQHLEIQSPKDVVLAERPMNVLEQDAHDTMLITGPPPRTRPAPGSAHWKRPRRGSQPPRLPPLHPSRGTHRSTPHWSR